VNYLEGYSLRLELELFADVCVLLHKIMFSVQPVSLSFLPPLQVIKFCTLGSNICVSLLWKLFHVTLLTPRILRWLPYFYKICVTLVIYLQLNFYF